LAALLDEGIEVGDCHRSSPNDERPEQPNFRGALNADDPMESTLRRTAAGVPQNVRYSIVLRTSR